MLFNGGLLSLVKGGKSEWSGAGTKVEEVRGGDGGVGR